MALNLYSTGAVLKRKSEGSTWERIGMTMNREYYMIRRKNIPGPFFALVSDLDGDSVTCPSLRTSDHSLSRTNAKRRREAIFNRIKSVALPCGEFTAENLTGFSQYEIATAVMMKAIVVTGIHPTTKKRTYRLA